MEEIRRFFSAGHKSFAIVYNPEDDFSYYLRLFAQIRDSGLKIGLNFDSWYLPTEQFIDDFARTFDLKKSVIALSVESGSLRIRQQFKGGSVPNSRIRELLRYMAGKGISANVFFSVGLPNEDNHDVAMTVSLINEIKMKGVHIGISLIPIEPNSMLSLYPEKFNITVHRKTFQDYLEFAHELADMRYPAHPVGYSTSEYSELALQKLKIRVWRACYLDWRYARFFAKSDFSFSGLAHKTGCALAVIFGSPRMLYKLTPGALS
jgi:radical SAM superfamily enzyme YgiQ (UPF0313 family)